MARHNDIGKWGENIACDILVGKGYAIIERNWRLNHLEIDIIASKGSRIVFAEVKTRGNADADPLEAIYRRKISNLSRAADVYIRTHDIKFEPQFDVFGISGTPDSYKAEHIEDAFLPPQKTYR